MGNLVVSLLFQHAPDTIIVCPYYSVIVTESLLFLAFMEGSWCALIWDTLLKFVEKSEVNIRLSGPWSMIWIRGLPYSSNRTVTAEESWLCFRLSAAFLSSPRCQPDRLWGTSSLPLNGYRWLVFRDKAPLVAKLSVHICWKSYECIQLYLHSATHHHGVVVALRASEALRFTLTSAVTEGLDVLLKWR